MTLINARRRFEAMGWLVERDFLYKYRARPAYPAAGPWLRGDCLETLLAAAARQDKRANT